MKKEEILEYNKRCAEFLGYTIKPKNGWYNYEQAWLPDGKTHYTIDELKFHYDWNWIKSVLDKILSLNEDDFSAETQHVFDDLLDLTVFSNKDTVCERINNFIKSFE